MALVSRPTSPRDSRAPGFVRGLPPPGRQTRHGPSWSLWVQWGEMDANNNSVRRRHGNLGKHSSTLRTGEGLTEVTWGPAQKHAKELVRKGRSPLGRGNHWVRRGWGRTGEGAAWGKGPLLGSGVQAFSHGSKGAEQRVRTISAGGTTAPLPTLCVALSLRLSPLAAEKTERLKAWQRAQAQKGCTDHKQLPPHGDSSWHHTKTVTSWQGGCEGGTRVQSQWVLTGARPPDQRAHPSWDPTRPPEHQTGGLPTQASVGKGEGGRQVTWAERLSADTSKHHPHLEAPAPHQLQKVRTGMN